ncbi:hypothetical protein [Streptosporangium sp. NPDC051022]|uniref:hypothetical protein n=1 Tax=Streptosporangium sp. NPDC051022 TaxID=3155752 RepID=UPI00342E002F
MRVLRRVTAVALVTAAGTGVFASAAAANPPSYARQGAFPTLQECDEARTEFINNGEAREVYLCVYDDRPGMAPGWYFTFRVP